MEKKAINITEVNKNYNIEATVKYAVEEFAAKDLATMIKNCSFVATDDGFRVLFIDRVLRVSYPEGIVTYEDSGEAVFDIVRILVLHHAVHAEAVSLSGKKISYKELPGGQIYIDPFTNRCIRALAGIFGDNHEALKGAVEKTDHVEETYGDYSCTVRVLSKVPITLVVYAGDDEFPANANILFDEHAASFLPTEDYTQLSSFLISSLKRIAFA